MTRDPLQPPTSRTWRDIPQPVVPRAMSPGGRWRLVTGVLRTVSLVAVGGLLVWGGWLVSTSLREDARAMPAAAKATPMKVPELRTDGVLDHAWLTRTLALPKNASLMELDLQQLRARLLADEQVISAMLTRDFPDRLVVQLAERSPVARVMTEWLGQRTALLVSRDGVIYAGNGYDPAVLETLPWLDGVTITPEGSRFRRISGMDIVADLLGKARFEAEHLYVTWNVVSLARLESDHKLEVRTRDGTQTVYFTTRDDFFRQLVKLNYIADKLAQHPGARVTIDLSLGQDVPVMAAPAEADPASARNRSGHVDSREVKPRAAVDAHSEQAFFALPPTQTRKRNREL